jgi:hypothetical protein
MLNAQAVAPTALLRRDSGDWLATWSSASSQIFDEASAWCDLVWSDPQLPDNNLVQSLPNLSVVWRLTTLPERPQNEHVHITDAFHPGGIGVRNLQGKLFFYRHH